MNKQQLEIMGMSLNPTKKLFLLAISEKPDSSRNELAAFMNCDATHVSTVTKKLTADGLLTVHRVMESSKVKYTILV